MSNPIKQRIQNIQNEVKQLHPLLETIFRKMPSIKKVEYTHGNTEKGADFILTKESEELGDTEYIGIIAKVGKITQNISTITEQIEECTLRRIACNGKKEIYLSEVWVAANGTISVNAREKIYDKYKTQKIKFLDINTLYGFTMKYVPDYGIDVPIEEANFLAQQKESCAQREQKFSLLPNDISHNFIPQEITQIIDDLSSQNKSINIYKKIEEKGFLSIESQMGGGKTTLLNNLVDFFSNLEVYKEKRIIPIYINSKEIAHNKKTLSEILEEKITGIKLGEDARRQFLLLLDSVDEMKLTQKDISERLVSLIEESNTSKNIKLIIASRNISNDVIESNEIFRNNRYQIEPLRLNGMLKFLETICKGINLRYRLIEDIKKSELFKVLPKTPIATIILARLLADGSEELPMNLTDLYVKYCELSLGRWDIEKGIKTQKQYEALDVLVSLIAEYMINNELPCLSKEEAKGIFKDYLSERNLQLDSGKLFEDMLKRSGILVEDPVNNTIAFKHRSFAEFYYAKSLLLKQHIKIDAKIFHPYWMNSYFFYVGLKKDCPELLNEIIDIPVIHEGHRFSRLLNLGSFLLAGYQSPYHIITKGITAIFVDAGNFYNEILEKKNDSYFSQIPPIHLCTLFNATLDQNYNFKFFEESINIIIEDLVTSPSKTEGTPYSLFFLDSIRFKLGSDALFDNLIELYDDDLPMVVQLLIGHKSDQLNYNSTAIKKTKKRIMKHRKMSRQFNNSIMNLYTDSIDGSIKLNGKKR